MYPNGGLESLVEKITKLPWPLHCVRFIIIVAVRLMFIGVLNSCRPNCGNTLKLIEALYCAFSWELLGSFKLAEVLSCCEEGWHGLLRVEKAGLTELYHWPSDLEEWLRDKNAEVRIVTSLCHVMVIRQHVRYKVFIMACSFYVPSYPYWLEAHYSLAR